MTDVNVQEEIAKAKEENPEASPADIANSLIENWQKKVGEHASLADQYRGAIQGVQAFFSEIGKTQETPSEES